METPSDEKRTEQSSLPAIALVFAFVLGPLGVGLAAWWLARRATSRGRTIAWAAIAIGLIQTLVVALVVVPNLTRDNEQPTPASSTWDYPTTPPPTGPTPDPSATPIPPTATTLEEFVPESVDSFGWIPSGVDSEAIDAGAEEAQEGVFTTDGTELTAGMAEWASPEEAASHALARAAADYPGQSPLAEGQILFGAGYYWYFESSGVGTVYWHHGKFSAEFSGEPREVQEFFLRFPK